MDRTVHKYFFLFQIGNNQVVRSYFFQKNSGEVLSCPSEQDLIVGRRIDLAACIAV